MPYGTMIAHWISEEKASDKKKLQTAQNRLAELDMLIVSVYEDKVLKKVPEEICVNLLGKYQTEKTELQAEVLTLEKKVADTAREENDVDEFIRRLKRYIVEFRKVKEKMARLGFTDYDEYLDYLEYMERRAARKKDMEM